MKRKRRIIVSVLAAAMLFSVYGSSVIAVAQAAPAEAAVTVSRDANDIVRYEYDEKEIWCDNDGQKIYGKAYIPRMDKEKMPLVIFSHELCMTHASGEGYAKELASRGVAVYTFDYRGGSIASKSDGKTTDMSVLTEVSDLEHVLATAKTWDFVDKDNIVILGGSQGGMVAAITASKHPDDLKGLVLLYPAFVITDELHKHFMSLDEVPNEYLYNGWIKVGKRYAVDAWKSDVYDQMKNFKKPVLIIHGDEDKDVPLYYSKEAQRRYPNAKLHIVYGTGHMFPEKKSFEEARDCVVEYLHENHIL